ncbi:MAG: alpha-amylase family glycosyl hydrolase [Acidimicrobiales bacterium]
MAPRSVTELDLTAIPHAVSPSPEAWEDEVLYFLMLDRFSDGNEHGYIANNGTQALGTTPKLVDADRHSSAIDTWSKAGGEFVGGTLKGLTSKMGYLEHLGVTAVWVSPVFRQPAWDKGSYHGYGIQHFLDVDPHFGTIDDLKEMVKTAHDHGIRVVLDVILNHTADVFRYVDDPHRYPKLDEHGNVKHDEYGNLIMDPRWDGAPYPVAGFNDHDGHPTIAFTPVDLAANPDDKAGVWPSELYSPGTFTQRGRITNWDNPQEYREGDFLSLKDVHLGTGDLDHYQPSPALIALTRAYRYWLTELDLDGYRVDTVKHMDIGAARYFASAIHEHAVSIGKEHFYLIAEITGGRRNAFTTLDLTGMDAALGIDDIPDKIEYVVKGYRQPEEYFNLFRNSEFEGRDSHRWLRNRVVTLYDDHDQVRKGKDKARFCADNDGPALAVAAFALNTCTLGIPCIYYGTEQLLDGHGDNDRFLREALFGGSFGPFQSTGKHLFDHTSPTYTTFRDILAARAELAPLRRGRQYLRQISDDGNRFGYPQRIGDTRMLSVLPWSRILSDEEVLAAINTDPHRARTVWVTVDAGIHPPGTSMRCYYSTDPGQTAATTSVEARNGSALRITVPPGGFIIYH